MHKQNFRKDSLFFSLSLSHTHTHMCIYGLDVGCKERTVAQKVIGWILRLFTFV